METEKLTAKLKKRAAELGFSLTGVTPAAAPPGVDRFDQWLAAGYAGEMQYLADRRDAYRHPRNVLEGARSIVMLAMNYRTEEPATAGPGQGRVSRYAWGEVDYHDLIRQRLNVLCNFVREHVPNASVRGVVDTAPLMERELAQLAGLGWIGKNTLLLNREMGSWFFLAALLTDVELAYDEPFAADHCGTCRACLDACPTDAFPQPYVLDASRCISYLTIELREAIPQELRAGVGEWVFGCDVCQDVCPWNSHAARDEAATAELGSAGASSSRYFAPRAEMNPVDLVALFDLDDAAFRERFRHTPLWRAKRRGMLRNAAIVLGNRPTREAVLALSRGLNDEEPLVRGACAWTLGVHGEPAAERALVARRAIEYDRDVLREIDLALQRICSAAVDVSDPSLTQSTAW
jgi:epoxyqueuosine reductase